MERKILESSRGPVRLVLLNDEHRANALSEDMVAALKEALEKAASESGVRAVVIGTTGKHFCAGADLEELSRMAEGASEEENLASTERLASLYRSVLRHPKLTVAAVRGAAIGGGCGLATACDLVVAEENAKFMYSEVKLGFVAALVMTFLTRRVTPSVARRLLLDPEPLSGKKAEELGLADVCVPEGEALGHATGWALSVARKASPSAVATTKELLDKVLGMDLDAAIEEAIKVNVAQRRHPECMRGVGYFLRTKQTPDWLKEDKDE